MPELPEVETTRKSCGKPTLPVLYLTSAIDESSRSQPAAFTMISHPLQLIRLAKFVESLTISEAKAA